MQENLQFARILAQKNGYFCIIFNKNEEKIG